VTTEAQPSGPRQLSRTQAATRGRILDAAVALATAHGYDGFGMRELAAAAGVSPATLYQYHRSKDAVLVDALVESGLRTSEAVGRRRPADARPLDVRIVAAFAKVVRTYERVPLLYQAMFRAYLAGGATPSSEESPWSGRSWLDQAVGDDVAEREVLVELLEHQVLASLVSLITGTAPREVMARFQRAVEHLCGVDRSSADDDVLALTRIVPPAPGDVGT
jgi:TetR/AcrR family transcriptional regulator, cholesterol catabolism regulator